MRTIKNKKNLKKFKNSGKTRKKRIRRKKRTKINGGAIKVEQVGNKNYSYLSLSVNKATYNQFTNDDGKSKDLTHVLTSSDTVLQSELLKITDNKNFEFKNVTPLKGFSLTPQFRLCIHCTDNQKNTYVRVGDSIFNVNFYSGSGLYFGFRSLRRLIENIQFDENGISVKIQNTIDSSEKITKKGFNIESIIYGKKIFKEYDSFFTNSKTCTQSGGANTSTEQLKYKVCINPATVTPGGISNSIIIFGAGPVGLLAYYELCKKYENEKIYLIESRSENNTCTELNRPQILFMGVPILPEYVQDKRKVAHMKSFEDLKEIIKGKYTGIFGKFVPISTLQKILYEMINELTKNGTHKIYFGKEEITYGTGNLIIDCTGNRHEKIRQQFETCESKYTPEGLLGSLPDLHDLHDLVDSTNVTYHEKKKLVRFNPNHEPKDNGVVKFRKGDRVFIDGLSEDNSLNETYGTVDVVSDGTDTISVKCDKADKVSDFEKKNFSGVKFRKGDRVFIDKLFEDKFLNETYGKVEVVSDGTDIIKVKCDEDVTVRDFEKKNLSVVRDFEKKNLSPDTFHFLLYLVYNLNINNKVKKKCIRFINPSQRNDKQNATEEPTKPHIQLSELANETDI